MGYIEALFEVVAAVALAALIIYTAVQCVTYDQRMSAAVPTLLSTAEKVCMKEYNAGFVWEYNFSCIEVPGITGTCMDDQGKVYANLKCYVVGGEVVCRGKDLRGTEIEWRIRES